MSIRVVADTHTILWYLFDDPRLSMLASSLLEATEQADDEIAISSVSLVEIVYLVEKGRVPPTSVERVIAALDQPNPGIVEVPLSREIVRSMQRIDRSQVPDMPDRIVAASALYLNVPAVSKDRKIRSSVVVSVW
jgi:PIN domain nuclease of toxin-antitoxin system